MKRTITNHKTHTSQAYFKSLGLFGL